jgi:hypothetical protein
MRRSAVAAVVAVAAGLALTGAASAQAQDLRSFTSSRRLGQVSDLDVSVTYGAGRFVVGPAPEGLLYRMNLRYDEDLFDPVADFDGKNLRLGVDARGRNLHIGKHEGGELRVELPRSVPMSLALDFGAGRATLDLGGLALRDLHMQTGAAEARIDVSEPNPGSMGRVELEVGAAEFTARRLGNLNARRIQVNAGVGDVTLDLTGEWRENADVSVQMGLGALELRLPTGVGVKLTEKTFLTSVDTQGLVKRGDAYYSLDWDRAERHVTVDIQAAFGSIDIRWVP